MFFEKWNDFCRSMIKTHIQVAQKNIRDIRSIIYSSLSDKNLGRALAQLKIIARPCHAEELSEIEDNYRAMLSYRFGGVEDPDADNIYNHLVKRAFELTDDVCAAYMPTDYSQNEVFSTLWNCYRFGNDQVDYCRVMNGQGTPLNNQIAVSAVTLNCLRILDEPKLHCLIDFCSNSDKKTAARALTGLMLCLIKHNKRIVYYPAVNNRLNLLFDNPDNVSLARQIVKHFIRCKENPRITKDIKDNILPTLSKMAPDIGKKVKDNFDNDDYEESVYSVQDMIQESGIADKMQAYSELQLQGSDINYSTFCSLKKFGFFQNTDSWFMPFYKENPAISVLFSQSGGASFLDFLAGSNFLCDSDKYSFCVNLTMVPEEMRKPMQKQLQAQIGDVPEFDAKNGNMVMYTNRYMQDIYRFYKLYRNKEFFDDIFELGCDVYNMDFFRFLDSDGSYLSELADFYLSKELYETALGAYGILMENTVPDAELYRKTAFCLQKNLFYTQAAEYYEKVDLMEGGNAAILKKAGYCHRKAGDLDAALKYYRQAEEFEPENLNVLFNIALCLTELRSFDKALNYFYKIDFLNPDACRSAKMNLYFGHCLWATGDKKGAMKHYMAYEPKDKLEENLRLAPCGFSTRDIYFIMDYIRYFGALAVESGQNGTAAGKS